MPETTNPNWQAVIIFADSIASGELTGDELEAIELLLYRETEYLDQCRYDDWLALFTDDCRYWVPARKEQTDPVNDISLFYEDRDLMEMRVRRLQHPRAHSLDNPITTSHVTGVKVIEDVSAATGEIIITTRFQMVEYQRGEQRLFAGVYRYHLHRVSEGFKISFKRVDLINCDAYFEPLQVFI